MVIVIGEIEKVRALVRKKGTDSDGFPKEKGAGAAP
jgi:hypothetical protein